MKTRIIDIKGTSEEELKILEEPAGIIKRGGLVAFPTETVYGLGADALNPKAIEKIYIAKGRPSDNPLIVHIADLEDLYRVSSLKPEEAGLVEVLAEKFWPGPLTMVLPKSDKVPSATTGGLDTVAVRMPNNKAALELIRKSGCPIAAPSANLSGRPSPTKGDHVVKDLYGRVDTIIKGDDCLVGIESTVLDMTGSIPMVLRPGFVTPEQVENAIGMKINIDSTNFDEAPNAENSSAPRSPGMKYTHYAPKAQMMIIKGKKADVEREIKKIVEREVGSGKKVGLIELWDKTNEEAAHDFFARLRELDEEGVDLILSPALDQEDSIGFALMNRMLKAAGYNIINV